MQTSSLGAATPGIRDSCICFNTLQVAASPSQRQLQLHLQLQIPGPGLSRKTSLGAATVAQKKKTKLWDSRLIYKRSKGGRADGGQGSGLFQLVPPLWQLTIGDNFSFSRASEQLQVMSKLCIKRRRGRGTTSLSLSLSLGVGDLTVATDIDMNRRLIDRATNNVQRAGSASAWGFLCHTLTAVSRLTRRPICCFHLCAPFHRHFNVEEDARAQLFAVVVVIFPPPDLLLLLLLLRRLREH